MIKLKPCPFCGKYPQTVVDDETEEKFGVKCFNCGGSIYPEKETLREAIKAWNRRTSIEPEPRWIPCSERLPKEEKKTYWVCTDTEYQCECRWTNNRFGFGEGEWGWSIFDTPQYSKPIAWMPLPEPYKAERRDE